MTNANREKKTNDENITHRVKEKRIVRLIEPPENRDIKEFKT